MAILRAIGTPCKSAAGFLNEQFGEEIVIGEGHAQILVWNHRENRWVSSEPQGGLITDRYAGYKQSPDNPANIITTTSTTGSDNLGRQSDIQRPTDTQQLEQYYLTEKPEEIPIFEIFQGLPGDQQSLETGVTGYNEQTTQRIRLQLDKLRSVRKVENLLPFIITATASAAGTLTASYIANMAQKEATDDQISVS